MAKQSQTEKAFLSGAGEFGTLSELLKRQLDARVTIGNKKAVDIQVMYPDGTWKSIEVRTSRSKHIITGYSQKYHDPNQVHPDYWVLVYIDKNEVSHYHILTHQELGPIQTERNGRPTEDCLKGVDSVKLEQIADFENKWEKIIEKK